MQMKVVHDISLSYIGLKGPGLCSYLLQRISILHVQRVNYEVYLSRVYRRVDNHIPPELF